MPPPPPRACVCSLSDLVKSENSTGPTDRARPVTDGGHFSEDIDSRCCSGLPYVERRQAESDVNLRARRGNLMEGGEGSQTNTLLSWSAVKKPLVRSSSNAVKLRKGQTIEISPDISARQSQEMAVVVDETVRLAGPATPTRLLAARLRFHSRVMPVCLPLWTRYSVQTEGLTYTKEEYMRRKTQHKG